MYMTTPLEDTVLQQFDVLLIIVRNAFKYLPLEQCDFDLCILYLVFVDFNKVFSFMFSVLFYY